MGPCLGEGSHPSRSEEAADLDEVGPPTTSIRLPYTQGPSTNPAEPDHQVSDLLIHWIYILNILPMLLGASP